MIYPFEKFVFLPQKAHPPDPVFAVRVSKGFYRYQLTFAIVAV
jgi:hypothetical protein